MKTLPTVNFCGTDISRLIIGGNPFSGNSHQNAQLDAEMEDFFTTQRIKDTLWNCLENGINTAQLRGDKHIVRILREFRLETRSMLVESCTTVSGVSFLKALFPLPMHRLPRGCPY